MYTAQTPLGVFKMKRVDLGVTKFYLRGIEIDTFYGEQFDALETWDEWLEYIRQGGDPLAPRETPVEEVGLLGTR